MTEDDPVTRAVRALNAEGPHPYYTDPRVSDHLFRNPTVEVVGVDADGHVFSAEMTEEQLVLRTGRPWSAEADMAEPTSLPRLRLQFGLKAAIRTAWMLMAFYSTPKEDRQ